jgi:hypothetical protein
MNRTRLLGSLPSVHGQAVGYSASKGAMHFTPAMTVGGPALFTDGVVTTAGDMS